MKRMRPLILIMLLGFLSQNCNNDGERTLRTVAPPASLGTAAYLENLATDWFDLQLQIIRETEGFVAPVASRAMAYSSVAMYESLVSGMPDNRSLVGQLRGLNFVSQPDNQLQYNWAIVANSALGSIIPQLYPNASDQRKIEMSALESRLSSDFRQGIGDEAFQRSVLLGRNIANDIFTWSQSDLGEEGYLNNFPNYAAPTGNGIWQPQNENSALLPEWGNNLTFVTAVSDLAQPLEFPTFSTDPSSTFYQDAQSLVELTNSLTDEQQTNIQYWENRLGTSYTLPGHLVSIANQILKSQQLRLDIAAELLTKLTVYLSDGYVTCWETKYTGNLLYPATFIQSEIDPQWQPSLEAPFFPEFTPEQVVIAELSRAVFNELLGTTTVFSDNTNETLGLGEIRSFSSFDEMADAINEAAMTNGLHFPASIQAGKFQAEAMLNRISVIRFRN